MSLPERSAGVVLHPTSLPSGTFGADAFAFVDWLSAAGCTVWQMLPLGEPDGCGSPYASPSAFAGSAALLANPDAPVSRSERAAFRLANAYWIEDWLAFRGPDALNPQIRFAREWNELHRYASARGVQILGDLPIYVAADGCDQQTHPERFLAGLEAGAAPDAAHPHGQHWGNPLYSWEACARDRYVWWVERLHHTFGLYDLARIDHFRGFCAAWAIPSGCNDPALGHFLDGPGADLFDAVETALGKLPLVAEDLGLITPDVIALRDRFAFPGMGVLVRGFHGPADNPSRPANHRFNQVVYTSTHDTDTARGFVEALDPAARAALPFDSSDPAWALIELAAVSPARLALCPLQDVLALDSDGRMNTPGTVSARNWNWQLEPGQLTAVHASRLRRLLDRSGRTHARLSLAA
jgi:4-alpha-glucanotransferase